MAHGEYVDGLAPTCKQQAYEEDVKGVTQQNQYFHTKCTINSNICKQIIDEDKEEIIIGKSIVDKL